MSAVTDTGKKIKYDPIKKPGISNLLTIYSIFGGETIDQLEKRFDKKGYADLKKELVELMTVKLESFRRKKKELLSREVYVKEILEQGRKRAESIAQPTMEKVRKKMGLI
jgi:tryptophanyl-tRNA synthetase